MSSWSPVSFFLPRYPCWSTANGNKKPRKILLVGEVTPHRAKASLQELGKAAVTHFLTLVPMVCRDPQPEPHLPLTKNSPHLIPLCPQDLALKCLISVWWMNTWLCFPASWGGRIPGGSIILLVELGSKTLHQTVFLNSEHNILQQRWRGRGVGQVRAWRYHHLDIHVSIQMLPEGCLALSHGRKLLFHTQSL